MDSGSPSNDAPSQDLWLPEAIRVLNASSAPHDYCKRLTTHPILGQGMVGNHLFLLDNSGAFRLLGGFGICTCLNVRLYGRFVYASPSLQIDRWV